MILVVGYYGDKPDEKAKTLLGGDSFLNHSTLSAIKGFNRFVTRNLSFFRESNGSVKSFLKDSGITWEREGNLLIGTV